MSVIQARNLVKSYAGKTVLNNINLTVEAGQVLGYIGPNGAGKSTTIKIICGIIDEFSGEVNVMGMDVRKDALEIKRRIGYVPEQAAMYDVLTPNEYLNFIGKLYHLEQQTIQKKTSDLLRVFELQDRANERMSGFSKGMRQKVLLISGLLHNPDIVFFDEPLSGLDANAVILVKEILLQLKKSGKTVFYSSHIMDVVEKISDRIIIINAGNIVADGNIEELKSQVKQGSLENIFTSLTGDEAANNAKASEFIQVLNS